MRKEERTSTNQEFLCKLEELKTKAEFHEIHKGNLYKSGYCDDIDSYMYIQYGMVPVTRYKYNLSGIEYTVYHYHFTDDFIVVKHIQTNLYTLFFRDKTDMID